MLELQILEYNWQSQTKPSRFTLTFLNITHSVSGRSPIYHLHGSRSRRHLRPTGAAVTRDCTSTASVFPGARLSRVGRGSRAVEIEMLSLVARAHEHYGQCADQTGGGRHPPEDCRVVREQCSPSGLRHHCHERVEERAELHAFQSRH